MRWRSALVVVAVLLGALWGWRSLRDGQPEGGAGTQATRKGASTTASFVPDRASFVGRQVCARCHAEENDLWLGSHHDLAMQEADERSVLGNFDDASFTYQGVTSTFHARDGKFFVHTDGPSGGLAEYEVVYTFGVDPLQQYLVEFPDGRLQALGIAWDARPTEEGGQRWFHLYPDERVDHRDPLHWTSPNQNWNFMCAECHSTNLRKNYDEARDAFETTWSEIDVSCEACHGPGSEHVAWAKSWPREEARLETSQGLVVGLRDATPTVWEMNLESGNAMPQPQRSKRAMEVCARCHSRRSIVHDTYTYGEPLLQTHRLALLRAHLYHPDGQILDEVYVHGSFLQSKMYAAGVRCVDCHEPHSLRLRREGNALCAACHLPERFDTTEHHFHAPASSGASCVACHMAARNYMVVDPRRDHSLRVPRPDLSVKLGTPNACNQCHDDRSAEWAAGAVSKWYGETRAPHLAEAIAAGRSGGVGAGAALVRVLEDTTGAAIVRATAAALLRTNPGAGALPALQRALRDPDALVRLGAVEALELGEPQARWGLLRPLLADPVRAVRLQVAATLASTPRETMGASAAQQLDRAIAEYRRSQKVNADRAEAHYNLGLLDDRQGLPAAAEASYAKALRRDSTFTATYVNLADLYRRQGRDADGVRVLRRGLRAAPGDAGLHHALGLALVRADQADSALVELEAAARLDLGQARYSYVYGVALHSAGDPEGALEVLESAHARHPNDRQLLLGLATLSRERDDGQSALAWARKLLALDPNDGQVRGFVAQLESELR